MKTTLDLALIILNKISGSLKDLSLLYVTHSFPVDDGFDIDLLSKILAEYGGKIEKYNDVYDEWDIKVFNKITVNAPIEWDLKAIYYYGENIGSLK